MNELNPKRTGASSSGNSTQRSTSINPTAVQPKASLSTKRKAQDQLDAERKKENRPNAALKKNSHNAKLEHEESSRANRTTNKEKSKDPSAGEMVPTEILGNSKTSNSEEQHAPNSKEKVEGIHVGEEGMNGTLHPTGATRKNSEQNRRQAVRKKAAEKCEICNTTMRRLEIGSRCPPGPAGLGFKPGWPCCSECTATLQKRLRWYTEDQQKKYPHLRKQNG